MVLFKFKALTRLEHTLDMLLHERLYCAPYADLNDPFEGQFMPEIPEEEFRNLLGHALTRHASSIKFKPGQWEAAFTLPASWSRLAGMAHIPSRICSLSSRLDDVRMWAHYADSHRGIAVEIDFGGMAELPLPVIYSKGLPRLGLADKTHTAIFTEKTIHWKYEREYRIIQDEPYYEVTGRIRAVHCGIRVSPVVIALLQKAIGDDVPIMRTTLDKQKVRVVSGGPLGLGQVS